MKGFLVKLWNFDWYTSGSVPVHRTVLLFLVIVIAIGYPVVEVLFAFGNASSEYNILSYASTAHKFLIPEWTYENFQANFPHIWLIVAVFCVLVRVATILHSYRLSEKEIGPDMFNRVFASGLAAFLVGAVSGLLLLAVMARLALATGLGVEWQGNVILWSVNWMKTQIHQHVPMLIDVKNYWLAFVLSVFLRGLPGYVVHWLSHRSRLLWLVTHRAHHAMEYLYPTSTAPAFNFDFLLHLPGALVGMVVSQMIYQQPLVMEMILWSTFAYSFEVFNHSIAHYQFCYHHSIVRFITRFFGDLGVYHLVHHSAYEQDQNINFGGTPFNFWDRVFGTYRKPYASTPPVGLTNQPPISHNPFRITFSGMAQLIYEWRMNKNWLTRLKIIFGGVYYKPPVTKDFLIMPRA